MLVSMVFPLVQLIILGNAFGGKIKDARLGVVDQDGGTQAVKVLESLNAIQANAHTFRPIPYDNDQQAMEDVRTGVLTERSSFRPSTRAAFMKRTIRASRSSSITPTTS